VNINREFGLGDENNYTDFFPSLVVQVALNNKILTSDD